MKILFSWIDKINAILPYQTYQNLLGENQKLEPLTESKSDCDPRILYSIVIGSYILLLTTMYHRRRANMKKDTKTESVSSSKNPGAYSGIVSMMSSCLNLVWSKEPRIQKMRELYHAREEYRKLLEQQTGKISEINHAMCDLQKDLSTEVKINEEKLSSLPKPAEDKSLDNDQPNSEQEELSQQYQRLNTLLTEYPEFKLTSGIDTPSSGKSLDQLQGDINEIRETIRERTNYHHQVVSCYEKLISRLRKELVEESHHSSSVNMLVK
jgi:peptidoglycan hydrolase CwlO-like protein